MKRGDIYLVDLNPTSEHEQKGTRPVLIISHSDFNKVTKTPWVLPITTGGGFAKTTGFAVALYGTKTHGIVRCDQIRAIDMLSRNGRKLESVPDEIINQVIARSATVLS